MVKRSLAAALVLVVIACEDRPLPTERPLFHEDGIDVGGSHFRYGTLSWAPTGTTGEVEFRLKVAVRRSSELYGSFPAGVDEFAETGDIITEAQGPTQFNFGDGSAVTPTLQFLVTSFSPTEDWLIGEALNPGTSNVGIRHTYSAGSFTAQLSTFGGGDACCRIGQGGAAPQLNNRPGGSYPLQTNVVVPLTGNSSPVSSMVPVVVVPPSSNAQFLVPAGDADHDAITWRLAISSEAGTGTGDLHPPSLVINGSTGVVTWNNTGLDQTNFWTTQIVIEDGTTKAPVDFLLKIQATVGSLPTCTISPAGPFTTRFGSPIAFSVTGNDADAGATVTLNSGGLPAGATTSPALPATGSSGVSTSFTWTPTDDQVGSYALIFSATDNNNQQGLCSTTVEVDGGPSTEIVGSAGRIVTVEEDGQTVAGIDIPQGTFQENVTVTVRLVDQDPCHDFLLHQLARCLEITAKLANGQDATLNEDVIVGLCLPPDVALAEPELEIFKFEGPQDRAVALKETSAAFLECEGFDLASSTRSNWLQQFASSMVKRVGRWLGPKPLMAAVDRGFGGIIPEGGALSFFTWATPIQISFAGLAVNGRNSGKDAFIVSGAFDMLPKDFEPSLGEAGFNPATHQVIVGFGDDVRTISVNSFKLALGRFVYRAPRGTTTGILYMEIHADGRFVVSGVTPNQSPRGMPTFRAFSLQIGHRAQGGGLECHVDGGCHLHVD